MARGYPDYSSSVGVSPEGKFLPMLSQGPIWFKDDFSTPLLKWTVSAGTAALTSSPLYVYKGYAALNFKSDLGSHGIIYTYIGGLPEINNLSVNLTFMLKASADFSDFWRSLSIISLAWRNGTDSKQVLISYNPQTSMWYCLNSSDEPSEIGKYDIEQGYWHTIRLEVNPLVDEYVRLRVDSKKWDLLGIKYFSMAEPDDVCTIITITIYAAAGKIAELWLDDFKIRYGES